MVLSFKARRASRYLEAIDAIQRAGITVNGCFILGLDTHTEEVFEQVLRFAEAVSLYEVQITVLTPFPGTPLYARLEKEGRLLYPGDWSRCTLFDVNYVPKNMTPDQLRSGMYWLSERLYSNRAMKRRRAKFFEGLRARNRDLPVDLNSDRNSDLNSDFYSDFNGDRRVA